MSDQRNRQGVLWAFSVTLLMVVGAAAANEDLRLVDAAKNQDLQQVRTLLSGRPDVNVRSEDGSTALLWAAHWNDLQMAELLVRAGADANAANDFRMTPLSQACTNGSAGFVDLLLKAGANPNTPIGTGETPLMTCARAGSADAVRMLLVHGADVNAKEPNQNQTALMWAAAQQHPKVLQTLIEASADLQAHTKLGFTALHFAARAGDMESTRTLLGAGVDVNIRSQPDPESGRGQGARGAGAAGGAAARARRRGPRRSVGGGFGARAGTNFPGSTALLVATVRGQVPLALFLLDRGADPNVLDAGFTPLHWAAGTWENGLANPVYGFVDPIGGIPDREAKLQLVKALLAHGANPNLQMTARPPGYGGTGTGGYNDAPGATAFIVAANSADVEMMRILLAAGADPHLVTKTNSNALLAATALTRGIGEIIDDEDRALEAVKFLLDLGVDHKAVTTYNENALFGPAYRGWNRMLELLIEKGAVVNTVNKAGVTPWLAASGFGDRLGGVLFNKAGADILAQARRGSEARPSVPGAKQVSPGVTAMRTRQKQLMLMMACGSIALVATISATLSAEQTGTPAPPQGGTLSATDTSPARALVKTYCVSCHNQRLKTAGLALDNVDADHVSNSADTWEKVVVKLRSRAMPPPAARRPDNATYDRVATWLENELDRAAEAHVNPGRTAELHRLNRTEYANAVRDLLGVEIDPKAMLPPDEQAFGFDNNADALSMQPALLDRYLAAAAKIARIVVGDPTIPAGFERYTALKDNSNETTWLWQNERLGEEFPLGSRGGIAARHYFPVDGEYVFKIRLDRTDTGLIRGLRARSDIEIRVDGARIGQLTVGGTPEFTAGNSNVGDRKLRRIREPAGERG